jgi:hypothetical protein
MTRLTALLASLLLLAACAAHAPFYKRNDPLFARIEVGMTQQQVDAITGPHDNEMPFPALHQTSWGYFYHDTWGYYCEFSVTFGPDGRVVSKFSRRINVGGDRTS